MVTDLECFEKFALNWVLGFTYTEYNVPSITMRLCMHRGHTRQIPWLNSGEMLPKAQEIYFAYNNSFVTKPAAHQPTRRNWTGFFYSW